MDTKSVARTSRTRNAPAGGDLEHVGTIATRELRGLALYRERAGEIEPLGRGVYSVPSRTSGAVYTVRLDVFGEGESCDCPDHGRHPEFTCLHLVAATIHRAKVGAARRTRHPALSPEAVAANIARMGA